MPALMAMREDYGEHACSARTASSTRSTRRSTSPVAGAARARRPGRRLVRHRLPRHRPGADPGHDREPPQRAGLAHAAAQPAHRARPAAARASRADGWTRRDAVSERRGAPRLPRVAAAPALRARRLPRRRGRAHDRCASGRMGREGEVVQELVREFERENPGDPRRGPADPLDARRTRSCSPRYVGTLDPRRGPARQHLDRRVRRPARASSRSTAGIAALADGRARTTTSPASGTPT